MSEFSTAYPNSTKTYVDGPQGVRVPVREVALENGASSLRVYDTSGPQGGFAVPNDVVRSALADVHGPVDTGPCTG